MHPTCLCATDAHACHVFGGYTQVASNDEIDGIVFNTCGPGEPVALSRDIASMVLTAD